jgi:hypothetical protein
MNKHLTTLFITNLLFLSLYSILSRLIRLHGITGFSGQWLDKKREKQRFQTHITPSATDGPGLKESLRVFIPLLCHFGRKFGVFEKGE